MFFWSGFPFIRFTIAFGLGIVTSIFLPELQPNIIFIAVFLILFLLANSFSKREWFIDYNWIFGLALILLSFALGFTRLFYANEGGNAKHLLNQEGITAYKAIVVTQPIQKGAYFKATVKLNAGKRAAWKPIIGKVQLYVKSSSLPFKYGDEVLIKGSPRAIYEPRNPEEFNYKRYLSLLNIYHQQFADTTSYMVLSSGNENPLIAQSFLLRNHFSAILEQYIHSAKELAIAKALLIGNKEGLDWDLKNTYASSGAMHVLAVSGLHVGIIYFMVLFILRIVPIAYRKEWLIAIIAIPLLWTYAFITGLSPSVLRAVTLFSILAIGKSIGKQSNMANLLAVSALILLLFDPFLLMQVGFQLSYVAVLGIIFIYPPLRKLWMPTHRVKIFLWDVTAISIAAQLATFPLSILYFHRFPLYFLISNLVVIPAATIIVWVGMILFFVSWFSTGLASFLGAILAIIIEGINTVLGLINHLPWSNLDRIFIDIPQTWVLYLLITFLFLFFIESSKHWAILASVSMMLFSILIGMRLVQNNKLKQVVTYSVYNHHALDFIQSSDMSSLMDSSLTELHDKIRFHIKPNRLLVGVNPANPPIQMPIRQLDFGKASVWNGISILVLEKDVPIDSALFDVVLYVNTYKSLVVSKRFGWESYDLSQEGALVIDL